MKKKRILHLVPGLDAGGIEMMLLNYYKHMDRSKIHFDFGMFFENVGLTGQEFLSMGSKVYNLTPKSKNFNKYKSELKELLENNDYDIIHAHQNYMSFIPLHYAKKSGVKIRIAHSHTTSVDNSSKLNGIFRCVGVYLNNYTSTHKMSCGIEAGKYIFGTRNFDKGNVTILENAIDTKKFSFSQDKREKVRKKLNLGDKFVIGTVGRLSEEKNHTLLLEIYKEIYSLKRDSCLIIVGEGHLDEKLKNKAKELGIDQQVYFLGRRDDINDLLTAFDVFVLPSLHEGFPVVCVEAQSTGVKCIFSDKVPNEVSVTKLTDYISLNETPKYWADKIINSYTNYYRVDQSEIVKKSGYDIADKAKWLENFYIECS